tara:strand:- start:17801 stop:18676 length:876 start_codon:yes stop_codon:yes gene_type:complete
MRASLKSGHFALMPRPAIDPNWLLGLPAYLSQDGQVVRASLKLLNAAWQANPTGTLHIPSFAALAEITGLGIEKATENHALLMQGWTVNKQQQWRFEPIAELAQSLLTTHQSAIEYLGNELLIQAQSPDLFGPAASDLANTRKTQTEQTALPVVSKASKGKVKRLLPENFALTPGMHQELENQGISSSQAGHVQSLFVDYASARAERSADWDATFRNWLRRAIQWGNVTPDKTAPTQTGAFSFDAPERTQPTRPRFAPRGSDAPKSVRARDDSFMALQRARQVMKTYASNS